MFRPKITKEEINELPVIAFEGKITLVDDLLQAEIAVAQLEQAQVVGIDTETKPSFTRGSQNKVSLLQIATSHHCFLFRLNKIQLPKGLAQILANDKITKIGLSLKDDLNGLNKLRKFKPAGFVDLQAIAKEYGILELGLQKMYAIIFGRKISKSQRLTNWENEVLTEPQQRYAATDAWASLTIYQELITHQKLTKKEIEQLVISNTLKVDVSTSVDDIPLFE
jgi:ribonuclease D